MELSFHFHIPGFAWLCLGLLIGEESSEGGHLEAFLHLRTLTFLWCRFSRGLWGLKWRSLLSLS